MNVTMRQKNKSWSKKDDLLLKELLRKRLQNKPELDYDIHLVSSMLCGEESESLVKTAFKKGEVKRDFGVGNTGNVFVEHSSWGKPAGIAKSTAEYWIYVLDGEEYNSEVFVGIKTDRLKEIFDNVCWEVRGGDNKSSKGKLIKVKDLLAKKSEIQKKTNKRMEKIQKHLKSQI